MMTWPEGIVATTRDGLDAIGRWLTEGVDDDLKQLHQPLADMSERSGLEHFSPRGWPCRCVPRSSVHPACRASVQFSQHSSDGGSQLRPCRSQHRAASGTSAQSSASSASWAGCQGEQVPSLARMSMWGRYLMTVPSS